MKVCLHDHYATYPHKLQLYHCTLPPAMKANSIYPHLTNIDSTFFNDRYNCYIVFLYYLLMIAILVGFWWHFIVASQLCGLTIWCYPMYVCDYTVCNICTQHNSLTKPLSECIPTRWHGKNLHFLQASLYLVMCLVVICMSSLVKYS